MDWTRLERELRAQPYPRPMPDLTPCAVLVLVSGEALVMEVRARTLRHQPGEVCFPGGRMEPGETAVQCALRETQEELGLPPERIEVLGGLEFLISIAGRVIYPVLARTAPETLEDLRPSPQEVEEVFRIPISWLREHSPLDYRYWQVYDAPDELSDELRRSLASYRREQRGHYWDYDGRLIWGMTARVIERLLQRG